MEGIPPLIKDSRPAKANRSVGDPVIPGLDCEVGVACIGIGIVTFNRLDYLQRLVEAVVKHTKSEYKIVVAEDGSTDGTKEWCEANELRVVSGPNGGVCWNKNRALFALQSLGCDPILLLEDDCLPVEDGWERHWLVSTAIFGHLSYAHPKIEPWLISGSGSATDPYVNNKATAQCSSVSALALMDTGYFDTRFKGYGVGHAEWTTRLKRMGYGFKEAIDAGGRKVKANLYITGGLVGDDAPTFKDKANVARNEALFDQLKQEPAFRNPWSNDEERDRFLAEMRAAKISPNRYKRMRTDAESDTPDLQIRHLKSYGKMVRRVFGERRSFIKSSGWMSSIALSVPIYEGEIVPNLSYAAITFLRSRVKSDWSVFEFSGGHSTVWWTSKVARTVCADNPALNTDLIRSLLAGRQVEILPVAEGQSPSGVITASNSVFDVVTIGKRDTLECAKAATGRLSPRGIIILDGAADSNVMDFATSNGFSALPLFGPSPLDVEMRTTTVLYRPDNIFDL